jgi:hypothetical protein
MHPQIWVDRRPVRPPPTPVTSSVGFWPIPELSSAISDALVAGRGGGSVGLVLAAPHSYSTFYIRVLCEQWTLLLFKF